MSSACGSVLVQTLESLVQLAWLGRGSVALGARLGL